MPRARKVFTYTRAEEASGRRLWKAMASWPVIAEVLHLGYRGDVYTVARHEGWPHRRYRQRSVQRTSEQRQAVRQRIADSLGADEGPLVNAAETAVLAELAVLPHACALCGYRVANDPDHSVWIGEDVLHRSCLARDGRLTA